ncbi:MAG TPA: hypothetical protein VI076_10850 [Actinopolymorphaceae bacterium]
MSFRDGVALTEADWSAHTYLHVGVLNATIDRMGLTVGVRDEAGRVLQRSVTAEPFTYRVFQIRVADIVASGVDIGHLRGLEFGVARSGTRKTVDVDDIRLTDSAVSEPDEQANTAPRVVRTMALDGDRPAAGVGGVRTADPGGRGRPRRRA